MTKVNTVVTNRKDEKKGNDRTFLYVRNKCVNKEIYRINENRLIFKNNFLVQIIQLIRTIVSKNICK